MLGYLVTAFSLGLTAGILPGPMLGLVIRETLEHGKRAGYVVASAPLLTDAPIIALALLVVGSVPPQFATILGFVGGAFVIWMGIDALRTPTPQVQTGAAWQSLWKAMVTNWLNPHPWLFWIPVGAPMLVTIARSKSMWGAIAFLVVFYLMLVGSKIGLTEIVSRSRQFLQGRTYRWLMQGSGMLLIVLGAVLIIEQL